MDGNQLHKERIRENRHPYIHIYIYRSRKLIVETLDGCIK